MFGEAARGVSHMQTAARKRLPDFNAPDSGEEETKRRGSGSGDVDTSAVQVRPSTSGVLVSEPQGRVTRFIFELWLWLQFAIVILVFLYAMARRGPKSVLEDAERRRLEMQRSARR